VHSPRRAALVGGVALAFGLGVLVLSRVAAEDTSRDTGQVTFRVTLMGQVDDRDAFVVYTRCEDEWCDVDPSGAYPEGQTVVACGAGLADHSPCTATTYVWTVELQTGWLEYEFVRVRDVLGDQEPQLQHSGAWEIHAGHQTLSFGYIYPAMTPTVPDTALPRTPSSQ
jgi:hypothetical protein